MATFGLDGPLIKQLKNELDVGRVRQDQFNDCFVLPQIDAIYVHCGDTLKEYVASKLSKSEHSAVVQSTTSLQSGCPELPPQLKP